MKDSCDAQLSMILFKCHIYREEIMYKILIFLLLFSFTLHADEKGFVENLQELSDQEQFEADNFEHAGLAQKTFEENCTNNEVSDLCQNKTNAFSGQVTQTIENLAPMIPVAMSTVLGSSNIKMKTGNFIVNGDKFVEQKDGSFVNTKAGNGSEVVKTSKTKEEMETLKSKDAAKEETENQTDFCVFIPMAVEGGVKAFQLLSNDSTEQQFNNAQPSSKQKASLEAIKQSQETLKTSSIVQVSGWGATTACYTGFLIAGATADFKTIAKLSASILMTTFYGFKIYYHDERIDAINEILKKFPKKGECNPHTETICFCNEESSISVDPLNFQKRCVPPPLQDRFDQSPFVCVDASGKTDNECLCKQNNNCIGQRLKAGFAKLGLNPSTVAPILQGISPLDNGTTSGNLQNLAQRNLAIAKKQLAKVRPKDIPNLNLTPKQKQLANEIAKLGIPNFAAAGIAATTPSNAAIAASAGITATDGGFKNPELQNAFKESNLRFSEGSSQYGSRRKNKKSSYEGFSFGKKKTNGADSGADVTILDDFQAQAQAKAEINKDSSKSIFEIITYRYTVSAWKKFEENFKADSPKEESQK